MRSGFRKLVAWMALVCCIVLWTRSVAFADVRSVRPISQTIAATEYFDLSLRQFGLDDTPVPQLPVSEGAQALARENGVVPRAGGALLAEAGSVLFASPDGDFTRIDLKLHTYEAHVLPPIANIGAESISESKRYTYQELKPRVHGIAFLRGAYYVTYDQYRKSDDTISYVIAKLAPSAKAWTEIYRSPGLDVPYYTLGGGGPMCASPNEGRIYFSVGDYSLDRINHLPSDLAPQQPDSPFGKTAYIDVTDDSIHPFTFGHRNVLGLALLADGRILESENGPKGGDKLDILTAGRNYGWPYKSYGTRYGGYGSYADGLTIPPSAAFAEPIYVFSPSVAPTQVLQVAAFDAKWNGNILLGSLKGQTLFNITLVGDRVLSCEPIPLGVRIRDIVQVGSAFVVLTDLGTFIEITKA
jgi:glucose/arabinose dehydrogenase